MKKLIVANLKANLNPNDTRLYLTKIVSNFKNSNIEFVVCPSFVSLSLAKFLTEGSLIKLGSQNICEEDPCVTTGETTGSMLKESGVEYVFVGHPDRRRNFKENSQTINKKLKVVLKNGLKAILFVGESAMDKTSSKTLDVITKQISDCLKGIYENELESIVIAYEPSWIKEDCGIPSVKDVENTTKAIREVIAKLYSDKASRDILVVYGGGLDLSNSVKYLQTKGIDGCVFGKTSLDLDAFTKLLNNVK